MNKRLPINISGLLMIFVLLWAPMLYSHSATVANSFILLGGLFCLYLFGAVLLISVPVCNTFIPVSHAAISIFTGSLVFSMALFFSANTTVLLCALSLITILLLFVFRRNIDWSFPPGAASIVCFVTAIAIIAIISNDQPSREFTAEQPGSACYLADYYYFTSIARAIREGSIFSAAYEVGSPINYQVFGFFIPGLWANLLHISSHQALWTLAGLFYKLLAGMLSYELLYYFLKDKVSRNNYLFISVAMLLPILMAPLHPLYLAKGDLYNFIYNGWGFLVPSGAVTFPIGMILCLLSLLLFSSADWKSRKITGDKVVFVIAMGSTIIAKVPLFFCTSLFIGIIVFKRIFFDREKITNYLGYAISFLALSVFLLKFCMSRHTGEKMFFRYGYLPELIGGWFHRSAASVPVFIGLLLVIYLLCMGLRLVGFIALKRSKDAALGEFFMAGIVSLVLTTVFASFLHIEMIDAAGRFIEDSTGNAGQFIRANFYIITIVSVIGMLRLFYGNVLRNRLRSVLVFTTVLWCTFSLASMLSYYRVRYHCSYNGWYEDNLAQLKTGKYNDGLIALNPSVIYCGLMLSSSDYGKYWVAMDLSSINYNLTLLNSYRWELFKNLLSKPEEKYFVQMKNEGVKYIIATPTDSLQMVNIAERFPAHMQPVANSPWIYKVH